MDVQITHRIDLSIEEVREAVMDYLRKKRSDIPDNNNKPSIEDISSLTVMWIEFEPKKQ